MPALGERNVTI